MAKKQKGWVYSPPRQTKPKVPDSVKTDIEARANMFIESFLKPQYVKPPPEEAYFNYIVDIYAKWYRNYFYFCARYHVPRPNAITPYFEHKFARLEYVADDRFNLAYMRHTEQWWEVYRDLSFDECLHIIKNEVIFQP